MSPDTGGPIRGFLGRWLMRLQAIQGIVQMISIEITAASTLSVVLQNAGYGGIVKYVFITGAIGTIIAAFLYVEFGLFNRKNRENSDRGANWSGPDSYMNSVIGACGTFVAMNQRPPTEDELEDIKESVRMPWEEYRNGIDVDD